MDQLGSNLSGEPQKPPKLVDIRSLRRIAAQESLIAYIQAVAPWFIIEECHVLMATYAEAMAAGEIDRCVFEMPPRGSKSSFFSIILPSWWAGKFPSDKIMQVGYKVDLSKDFSRDVQNIMRTDVYKEIFPGVHLAKDSHAAGRWRIDHITEAEQRLRKSRETAKQGQYFAAGVTSGIAGTGFNLGLIDDPMSEQDKDSKIVKDRVWNWWGPGFYTRRQPERNVIAIMTTRWAVDDLVGRLLVQQKKGGDKFEVCKVPAILNEETARKIYTFAKAYNAPGLEVKELKAGDSFAPRRWTLKELNRSKRNMTDRDWNALYMQNPTLDEGHILKRHFWKLWPKDKPPVCFHVFTMWDTAFDDKEGNSYTAQTTWGLFNYQDEDGQNAINAMLLGRWKKRLDAPDLPYVVEAFCTGTRACRDPDKKTKMFQALGRSPTRELPGFNPDHVLIENKASGIWLIKQLRRQSKPRLPIRPWNPPRGDTGKQQSKYVRALMASWVFEQGAVWYMDRQWAVDVIDECAKCKFDGSDDSDDLPDTVTASMIHVRQTFLVDLPSDEREEEEVKPKQRHFYGA